MESYMFHYYEIYIFQNNGTVVTKEMQLFINMKTLCSFINGSFFSNYKKTMAHCLFSCFDDAFYSHGNAVSLKQKKKQITPSITVLRVLTSNG